MSRGAHGAEPRAGALCAALAAAGDGPSGAGEVLHTFQRVFGFGLGFDHADQQRSGHLAHLHAQQIIGAASAGAAAALGAGGLDRCRRFQLDAPMAPALVTQDRIDQLVAGFCFVACLSGCHTHPLPVVCFASAPTWGDHGYRRT